MAIQKIAVAGAGTMGAGIAQVFAQNGFQTTLFDVAQGQLDRARQNIQNNLKQLEAKGKLNAQAHQHTLSLLQFISEPSLVRGDVIIEAIVEDEAAKQRLFTSLIAENADAIFCSNTSSLSITRLAKSVPDASKFAGMHFFNPATIMKLVEIVKGPDTSEETVNTLKQLCDTLGKTAVVCLDSPGFIVNRVARHYYVESLKIIEEKAAVMENTDALLESAGFKMGPFRLMDTIGNDINYAVTSSLYEAFHGDPKFRPSRIQQQKVASGNLGKKTGKGFYDYN
ncbi:MAG: 3-hydroxyacyl-CoA dehydrogenase NAD-binding domain-containing protein [Chitinophagales bacterium]